MVETSESGRTCPPADPEALADSIVKTLDEPATDKGRRWVAQEHSRDVLAERLVGVLNAVRRT